MAEQQCKNCGNDFLGKYCNVCGEKVYTEKEKTLRHIIGEGLHFLTHFEGKFFNTLKVIFFKPGKLSLDYCNGVRIKYFKPLSFFLMLVILYLLFPVFEGLNMKLAYHKIHLMYGDYATSEVSKLLSTKNITEPELENLFHHAGEKSSKFLLFIIIPALACFSLMFSFRKKYYDHFVFSIEACSFFILWSFLLLPVILGVVSLFTGFSFLSEGQISIAILVVLFIYLTIASKRFFNFKWWYSILYALLYSVFLLMFLEFIYKFILFFIAIRLI